MSGKYVQIRHECLSVRHSNRKLQNPLLVRSGRKVYKDSEPDVYKVLTEGVLTEYQGTLDEAAADPSIRLILGEDKKPISKEEMTKAQKTAAAVEAEDLLPPKTNQTVAPKAKGKAKSGD